MKKQNIGALLLLSCTLLWGFAFVMQNRAGSKIDAFSINAIRCLIGAICLLPFSIVIIIKKKINIKQHLICGIVCGLAVSVTINFQQFGIQSYPADTIVTGRSAFLTSLYVVFVPVISILFNRKLSQFAIIGVMLAILGTSLLCLNKGIDSLYIGDLYLLICSIAVAVQIICIGFYSVKYDINGIVFTLIEIITASVTSFILVIFNGFPSMESIIDAKEEILYLGVISCGIGYTIQTIGQKLSNRPTIDSIIMSFESVIAALCGLIFMNQKYNTIEFIGCGLMFAAVIISQLNPDILKKKKESSK